MPCGALVISFDFEMAWAYRRGPRLDADAAARLRRTPEVVVKLLQILDRYSLSATWATVGNLMLRPEDCTGGRFSYDWPAPQFPWFQGEWYDSIPAFGEDGADLFYSPDSVERIVSSPTYQELASHTFTHVLIGDPGCSEAVARAEFDACQKLARNYGRELRSVVFPRNYANHLPVLEETGYLCYRGSNTEWYWLGRNWNRSWRPLRTFIQPLRYLDERLPVCPPLSPPRRVGKLWEISHSMFFPGFTGISKYVSADDRARRATLGLRRAAERGQIFSLYTHPENFLQGTDILLEAFARICQEGARLRDAGQLDVLPMEQIAERLERSRNSYASTTEAVAL